MNVALTTKQNFLKTKEYRCPFATPLAWAALPSAVLLSKRNDPNPLGLRIDLPRADPSAKRSADARCGIMLWVQTG